MESTIIFVYNADKGLFNVLTDSAHKLLSPDTYQCNLCSLTYSALGMRKEWKEFLEATNVPIEFLHKDELKEKYGIDNIQLPAAFIKRGGSLELVISSESINVCKSINDLKILVKSTLIDVNNNKSLNNPIK